MDGCRDAGVCVSSTPVLPTCGFLGGPTRPLSAQVRHCGWTGGLVDWAVQVAIARSAYRRDISRDFLSRLPVDLGLDLHMPSGSPFSSRSFPSHLMIGRSVDLDV